MPSAYVRESLAHLLESRARWNTLDAEIHLAILRTHDCIAESLELMDRLDVELTKLSAG